MSLGRSGHMSGSGSLRGAVCVGLAMLFFCNGQMRGAPVPPDAEPLATQQLELWIKQLNDERFGVRTRAMNNLIEGGAAVVERVAETVEAGNLEVATRGVYVLRKLAYGPDVGVQERSLQALREIAQLDRPAPARLAREALAGLDQRRQQRALERLAELGASIKTYGIAGFAANRQLEIEIGPNWSGTLEDLKYLMGLQDLRKLTFAGPQVTDSWIESIRDLDAVNHLVIKNARVTDDALRDVARLETLVYVDLMYTPVTDGGLNHLKTLKGLRMIRCYGTKITREAAERLDAELTRAEVKHKMGAFLGVSCQPPPRPCTVISVTADSGAEKAGIKPKDIIVRFDNHPVASFEELERLIAQNKVGDTVPIDVARGDSVILPEGPRQPGLPLGIEGKPTAIGVEVKAVNKGSAGADAGIRVGDWIVAVGDQRIASMDQLRKHYEESNASRIERFEILRDVDIRTTKVTFGPWDERR